jgi:outer membrane receptor protein involved in Fe transport
LNAKPFSWFQNRITAGFDNLATQAQVLFLPGDIDPSQDPEAAKGANLRRNPSRRVLTLDYAGTLNWSPRSNLESTTILGSQVVSDKSQSLTALGVGIGAPDVTLVGMLQTTTGAETFSEYNSVGYFVQEQLGWNNRLFVTGAVRADDHSSFGTNFNVIVYPKFSLSYVLSEEPAARRFIDATRISTLKLRGAWGQAGKAPTAYSAPQTYTTATVTVGTGNGSAIRTAAFGNPDLKPERGEEIELGFDLGALKERLGMEFTYYNKKTTDMLQSTTVAPSTGFITTQLFNLGSVRNSGVEISLFGTPVQAATVAWETRLNYSRNDNVLLDFGFPGKVLETPTGQPYGTVQQHRPGYPLGGYWVTPPQRGPDGAALLTASNAAIFNTGDTARRYYGPSTAPTQIGFSNTVTLFRHFRVYGLLDWQRGGYTFNLQERNRCQGSENCARMNNPSARNPKTAADTILAKEMWVYRNSSPSPEFIQSTDFMKLRELSLTVDVPSRLLARTGAQSAHVTFSGRNLKIWSGYEGVDPEVNSYGGRNFVRIDAYAAPMQRRLSVAMNLEY